MDTINTKISMLKHTIVWFCILLSHMAFASEEDHQIPEAAEKLSRQLSTLNQKKMGCNDCTMTSQKELDDVSIRKKFFTSFDKANPFDPNNGVEPTKLRCAQKGAKTPTRQEALSPELLALLTETQGLIPQVAEMAISRLAKSLRLRPKYTECGMTDLELYIINGYTGSSFRKLNKALRSGDPHEAARFLPMVKVLNSALDKLADESGTVLRGVQLPDSAAALYQKGSIVPEPAYISTSRRVNFPGNVKMALKISNCKYIAPLSANEREDEVVCKPGSSIRVIYREEDAGSIRIYGTVE